tara:strand:+ start:317 stop:472 length:156 start_codon:yes stop_codon:yes gene_type:complete
MNQREAQEELKKIEAIARRISRESTSQKHGTEYQKWTYALLKARKEYHEIK